MIEGDSGAIKHAVTDEEVMSTFHVMNQLRPQLLQADYVEQVNRLKQLFSYEMIMLMRDSEVKAVAGYKLSESLSWGLYMYVDDLIVDAGSRELGYGRRLLDWVIAEAVKRGCKQLHLDSGVMRYDAHRLYLKAKMNISCHHFELAL